MCFFGSHTCVPISWICQKQTSFSHSSRESEIISMDAGFRLDVIPALGLWDLIVAVLHGNTYQSKQERGDPCANLVRARPYKLPMRKKYHGMIDEPRNVDFSLNRGFFSSGSFVVSLRRQRSSDQDNDQKTKPNDEKCFQKPKSCS